MTQPSVFQYDDPKRFLLDCFNIRKSAEPGFSMRSWAREMGIATHTLLVMLLQGKRPLRVRHVEFLAKGLKLSAGERLYLQALIQFESAPSREEKALCALWLADLNPGTGFTVKELDEFKVISHWSHTAILAMADLEEFEWLADDEVALSKRLGGKITPHEARAALARLTSLGLLERVDGRLRSSFRTVTTRNDLRDEGARVYHREVSALAAQAVERVPLDAREFQSFALAVDPAKMSLAKQMIRKFRAQFAHAVGAEPRTGKEVFQMNLQFFQLTESRAARVAAQDEGAGAGFEQLSHKEESLHV